MTHFWLTLSEQGEGGYQRLEDAIVHDINDAAIMSLERINELQEGRISYLTEGNHDLTEMRYTFRAVNGKWYKITISAAMTEEEAIEVGLIDPPVAIQFEDMRRTWGRIIDSYD